MKGVEFLERRLDVGDHRFVDRARYDVGAMGFGEVDDAERQRGAGDDGGGAVLAADPHQLGAAAADVEHQGVGDLAVDQRRATGDGKLGLLIRGDDLDLEPGLRSHPVEEKIAVAGPAAGFGGDVPRPDDPAPAHLQGADLERVDGAVHGGARELAVALQPLAEPDDAREGVDHPEAAVHRLGHQQAAVVGAEIERRIGALTPLAAARIASPLGSRTVRAHGRRTPWLDPRREK